MSRAYQKHCSSLPGAAQALLTLNVISQNRHVIHICPLLLKVTVKKVLFSKSKCSLRFLLSLTAKKKKKIAELLPASSREGQNWKVLIQCTEPLFFFFHRKLVKVWETRLDSSERHKKMSYLRTSDILICTPSLKKRHSKQDKKQKHWEEQKAGSS